MTDLYGNIPISDDTGKKASPSPAKSTKDAPPSHRPKDKKTEPKGRGKYFIIPAILVFLLASYYGLTTLFVPLFLEEVYFCMITDVYFSGTELS